jgi:2,3-bisphosphoglycerate-dependent phosphoglycerate mutase
MSENPTQLYLIRHGEADSNVNPIIGGMKGDKGLTPLGIIQAEALRDRLAETSEIQPDVLISSTLPRAWQTAKIIAPALGLTIIPDDDVQELRVGEADGMHAAVYREKYGLPNFLLNPYRPIAPGGENWGGFVLRVGTALERIAHEHAGKKIIIVCHGGVIDASLIIFSRSHTLYPPPFDMSTLNTSITEWRQRYDEESNSLRWILMRYNDAYHVLKVGRNPHISWRDVPLPEHGGDVEHSSVATS